MKNEQQTTLLSHLNCVNPNHVGLLGRRGIRDVRMLLAVAQLHEVHQGLRKMLDMTEGQLDTWLAQLSDHAGIQVATLAPKPIGVGRLGCIRKASVSGRNAGKPWNVHRLLHGGLPGEVNMVDRFGSVRDQGMRGTCVAHAFCAVSEFFCGNAADLSEQFLYWACKQQDGHDGSGTYMSTGTEVLEDVGVCDEPTWPYNPEQTDSEDQGPAPAGAEDEAKEHRIQGADDLDLTDVEALKVLLAYGPDGCGVPFAIAVPVFPSWGNAETCRTGTIIMPFDSEQAIGGHALCVAGYRDDASAPGGGHFLIRNSWGTEWAAESPVAPGYGLLPYAYVSTYGYGGFTMNVHQTATKQVFISPGRNSIPVFLGVLLATLIFAGISFSTGRTQDPGAAADRHGAVGVECSVPPSVADKPEFAADAASLAVSSELREGNGMMGMSVSGRLREMWMRLLRALKTLKEGNS